MLVAAALLLGCSVGDDGSSDKAGGSDTPVVVRLADTDTPREAHPHAPAVRWFAARVAGLSDGALRASEPWRRVGPPVRDVP